jgi:hypothetical protein
MPIGERLDQDNGQRCLICGHVGSVARDWPTCPACKFDQTSPEAYAIRKARGLLWRSAITDALIGSDPSSEQASTLRTGTSGHSPARPLFAPGQIVATPGALAALERAHQTATEFLRRHLAGECGALDAHDIAENECSLTHGFMLLSSYRTAKGEKVWVITEADRSITSLILPEEY